MCRLTSTRRQEQQESKKEKTSLFRVLVNAVLVGYIVGFSFFRLAESYFLFTAYPLEVSTTVVAAFFLFKGRLPWQIIAVLSMVAFVYVTDDFILDPIPTLDNTFSETVVVITGANSGIGFETSKVLAGGSRNITVVMACRSMKKCTDARNQIQTDNHNNNNVVPLQLDLNDFNSVYKFTESVQQSVGRKVDVLFNNAGYSPPRVEQINKYGLDPSFTAMHLSHHLLTELLVHENPSLRVVTTSSGTHHFCAWTSVLPKAIYSKYFYAPGCIDEEYLNTGIHSPVFSYKYITSKVANIMHTAEMSRRHPSTTAISIDLGFVGTSILSLMRGSFPPTSLGLMRSASIGIYPVLQAILQPLDYFDSQEQQQSRDWSSKGGLLIDTLGSTYEPFSRWWWRGKASRERMEDIGRQLWEKSTVILKEHGCTVCTN